MSDTTDDMEMGAALYEQFLERQEELVRRKIWTTKDGREVPIHKMTDSHLANTIRLLRRAAETWREKMLKEAHRTMSMVQGEQANIDIERDIAKMEEALTDEIAEDLSPHFENLVEEATKRKLEVIND